MNKKIITAIAFTVGAAVGSAVTWKVVKTKYERIAQEEIDSVKEEYVNMTKKMRQRLRENAAYAKSQESDEAESEEEDDEYPDDDERDFTDEEKRQIEYYKLTSKYRSHTVDDSDDDEEKEEVHDDEEGGMGDEDEVPYINGPYVISPEDFACSPPGYFAQPLDYFIDGVLADSWGVPVDIEETIGEEALEHFGDYVDDIVHVRNDRKEIDYEVVKDPRTYQDKVATSPNPYYGR